MQTSENLTTLPLQKVKKVVELTKITMLHFSHEGANNESTKKNCFYFIFH